MMRIVIAAPVPTYPGVPHAGGELLLRHIRALLGKHQVTLLIPRPSITTNEEAALRLLPCTTYLIDSDRMQDRSSKITKYLRQKLIPVEAFSGFWHGVSANPEADKACKNADLIELQWFEMIVTAMEIRGRGYLAPISGIYHDVVSQRMWRDFLRAKGTPRRAVRRARWWLTLRLERRMVNVLAVSFCLSEKDADLLRPWARNPERIIVLNPPLTEPDMPMIAPELSQRQPIALLVAQFSRPENDEAARWLLADIWPKVRAKNPKFQLVLAGGGMSDALTAVVDTTPGVTATGYLPSLTPIYQSARVALSPILRGAGVKFKSIVPMLWGIPVIATEIGAEGINRELFFAIEDDPTVYAAAVTRALAEPPVADESRNKTLKETSSIYGEIGYRETIERVYGDQHVSN